VFLSFVVLVSRGVRGLRRLSALGCSFGSGVGVRSGVVSRGSCRGGSAGGCGFGGGGRLRGGVLAGCGVVGSVGECALWGCVA